MQYTRAPLIFAHARLKLAHARPKLAHARWILAGTALFSGCTGQLSNAFRYAQQEQVFSSQLEVNTQVDLLWVVDNSASMDVTQENLRQGFEAFARKYLKPTWDIQVAVITTDTYLADPAFRNGVDAQGQAYMGYLDRFAISGSYTSAWAQSRASSWQNPSWAPSLMNLTPGANYGRFSSGLRYRELVPAWFAYGSSDASVNFARLLPGLHDGPIAGLCTEDFPTRHFLGGRPHCQTRDSRAQVGPSHCLSPDANLGESALTQCVNTVQNDTVRSGKAILRTQPPTGVAGDETWIRQLVDDFRINVTTGSAGHGSERGLQSVLSLMKWNENTSTKFFRPGSIRGILFVSDEDDQSVIDPTQAAELNTYRPNTGYRCDLATLQALNGGNASPTCCASGCTYSPVTFGADGNPQECQKKQIDGIDLLPSICAPSQKLIPVSQIHTQMDQFFATLDSSQGPSTSWFVSVITPLSLASIQALQSARDTEDLAAGVIRAKAVDRGDRYLDLADRVAAVNGRPAVKMDLSSTDYGPILEAIGRAIVERKATFQLTREPTGSEDMQVKVLHADGSSFLIPASEYVIQGKTLTLSNLDRVLAFSSTDQILINYQPRFSE